MGTKTIPKKGGKASTTVTPSHMPRLDTIEMVEGLISRQKEFDSRHQLWRSLPRQVQYKTFTKILDYLERSNKIMYDKKGAILWIFADNPGLKRLHRESTLLR